MERNGAWDVRRTLEHITQYRRDFKKAPSSLCPKTIAFEVNERVAAYYHARLMSPLGQSARTYLAKRGVGEEDMVRFQIGLSGKWQELRGKLYNNGVSQQEATALGLLNARGTDFFRQRIMIPIREPMTGHGLVVGFGGRDISLSDKAPKYLNTKETLLFKKDCQLYGLYDALLLGGTGIIVLVEGYFDAIALLQRGVAAVAACGTAFTDRQASLLASLKRQVVICTDPDKAGEAAMLKAACALSRAGASPKGVYLPDGFDPADFFLKYKGDAADYLLRHSVDPIELEIRNFHSIEDSRPMYNLLAAAGTDRYVRIAAAKWGLSTSQMWQHVRRYAS